MEEARPIPNVKKHPDETRTGLLSFLFLLLFTSFFVFLFPWKPGGHDFTVFPGGFLPAPGFWLEQLLMVSFLNLLAFPGIILSTKLHRGSGIPLIRNLIRGRLRNVLLRLRLLPLYALIWALVLWPLYLISTVNPVALPGPEAILAMEWIFRAAGVSALTSVLTRGKSTGTVHFLLASMIMGVVGTLFLAGFLDRCGMIPGLSPLWWIARSVAGFILGMVYYRHGLETSFAIHLLLISLTRLFFG